MSPLKWSPGQFSHRNSLHTMLLALAHKLMEPLCTDLASLFHYECEEAIMHRNGLVMNLCRERICLHQCAGKGSAMMHQRKMRHQWVVAVPYQYIYEVTPHIHQYFTNTFIDCVILLPRWALLMLHLSESSNRQSSISFSNKVLVTHQEPLPPSPLPPTSHQNSVHVSSTSGAHSGSHS